MGGYSNYSLIRERTGVGEGLVGCVRRVDVNGKPYDMRRGAFIGDALHGFDVGQSDTSSVCLSVTRSCSASDSDYFYIFLRRVVCLSSVTFVHPI